MGFWYETCFASHLAIPGDTRVVAIPVIQVEGVLIQRITPSIWRPVGLPVRGSYDDYGGIILDDGERENLEPLVWRIEHEIQEVDKETRNRYRRGLSGLGLEHLAPKEQQSMWGSQGFLRIVMGSRFKEIEFGMRSCPVYWAFLREEVYDFMVNEFRQAVPWGSNEPHYLALLKDLEEMLEHQHQKDLLVNKLDAFAEKRSVSGSTPEEDETHRATLRELMELRSGEYGSYTMDMRVRDLFQPSDVYNSHLMEHYIPHLRGNTKLSNLFVDLIGLDDMLDTLRLKWGRIHGPQMAEQDLTERFFEVKHDLLKKDARRWDD